MTKSLAGKVALVTGASRGIGRAIALSLGRRGATVLVHYANARDAAEDVVCEIGAERAIALQADLADANGAASLATATGQVLDRFGQLPLDILVNNAGVSCRAPIEDVTQADLARVMQVNFHAPFFLIQHLLPRFRAGGRIVNVSSMGVRSAYPGMAAYAPSKAALEALTLVLAAHLGPRGITINAVRPGATATDMNAGARDPVTAAATAKSIALGRVGQPDDIADIVAFLASDDARWITGQCLDASGGQRL